MWGIGFPPPQFEEGICAALIECCRCHTVRLSYLSMIEHEVLGTSGLLVKPCDVCARSTPWSYSETSVATPLNDAGTSPVKPDGTGPRALSRAHHRVALELPIRVRNYYGIEELTRSENVSRGGMCFITEKAYEVVEVLLITCPYEKGGHNIEVRGQVVSRRDLQGTGRKVYGVSYERT